MTDINITQSNTILTNNKSKTDDTFVAEVEEGVMTDSNKTKMPPPKTTKTRLSMVSQQYDINKDGVLDEAELASTLQCFRLHVFPPFHIDICLTCHHYTLASTKQCAISTRADEDS